MEMDPPSEHQFRSELEKVHPAPKMNHLFNYLEIRGSASVLREKISMIITCSQQLSYHIRVIYSTIIIECNPREGDKNQYNFWPKMLSAKMVWISCDQLEKLSHLCHTQHLSS